MGLRSLVSFGLLALPIGVTLGILIGIEQHRQATGQAPIFGPPSPPTGTGTPSNNGITTTQYCQKSYGISPKAKGEEFTLNPNQWGWTEGTPGGLCMNVTTFNNNTYPTNTTAPQFTVTWTYPQGPDTQPVHAFPNIRADSDSLPVEVSSLSEINFDLRWTYGVGNDSAETTDTTALTANNLNANVAIDMFIDSDKTSAQNNSKATHEVMVWLADFGGATQPIGLANGAVTTEVLNGTTFSLYFGQNGQSQYVLTWVASATTETFVGDISPLVTKLPSMNHANFPSTTDYLGYVGFGSEALYATDTVTFSVPELSIDIRTA